MEDKHQVVSYLDTEVSYFLDIAKHCRNLLTGLLSTGLASIAALLALVKTNQISFPDGSAIGHYIPYYAVVLMLSYGMYLLFKWYDVRILVDSADKVKSKSTDAEIMKAFKRLNDPYSILVITSVVVGVIAFVYSLLKLSSSSDAAKYIIGGTFIVFGVLILIPGFSKKSRKAEESSQYIIKGLSRSRIYYGLALLLNSEPVS